MAAIEFDLNAFRAAFPAFAPLPSSTVSLYWDFATDFISDQIPQCGVATKIQTRFINLMTAHLLAINAQVAAGDTPGITIGATIDKVSVTIQPPPERNQWQYWLNQTPYGQQLLALLQVQSAGGFYVGGSPVTAGFRREGGRFF